MQFLNSLLIAFSMYSRIPVPHADWSKKNMRYVMCCFPLVGAVIGGAVWLLRMGLSKLQFGKGFDTVIMVLLPVFLTGGIHLDGFLDTMDALSSYEPKERRLEILSDPHTGAFAVISAAVYFLLQCGVWSEMTLKLLPLAAMSFVFSRVLSGYAVTAWKSAKKSGLAAEFKDAADRKKTCWILAAEGSAAAAVMFLIHWQAAFSAILTAFMIYGYYRFIAYKKFGGVSGDLAGWFLQLCELGMMGSLIMGREMWF